MFRHINSLGIDVLVLESMHVKVKFSLALTEH